jgi:ribose transport system ATP-binding protein
MSSQHREGDTRLKGACPLLQTRDLQKHYPGVTALDRVNFELQAGEVHVLFGENGAGKSTLISMIAGANQPNGGRIEFKGEAVQLRAVHEARELGISAVFQEFSLIPQLTVLENLFLGAEPTQVGLLDKKAALAHGQEILDRLEFHLPLGRRVDQLTRAEQQMVEIAKAFRSDVSVLILDEPTASLTDHETEQLFKLIGRLKADGVGIVYITHRMAEIRKIGDRITILRDGRYIDTVDAKTTSEDKLVSLMTGRVVGQIFPDITFEPGVEILKTDALATADGAVRGASLAIRRGEIVGLAGLVGSGKSSFAQACFGARPVVGGKVWLKNENVTGRATSELLKRGFLYLPANRHTDGLMLMRPARENMSLAALNTRPFSNGWTLDRRAEARAVDELAEQLNLSPRRVERAVEHFSGGNQQKVMLARSLTRDFDLIAFDEPTVGVDVGTRAAIYEFIAQLCKSGVAILLISSDLPEILHLSNRAFVFYRGRIQTELTGDDISEENVLSHFFEREAA